MEQTLRRLSIRMETSGTATLIENTTLYKGGYAFVGLRAFVPITQNRAEGLTPLCTVHGVVTDSFGNRVQIKGSGLMRFWNMLFVEKTTINGFDFLVFERLMPPPLTATVGDLDLVFNYTEITADGKLFSRLSTNTLRTFVGEGGEADGEIDVDLTSQEAAQINANTIAIESMLDEVESLVKPPDSSEADNIGQARVEITPNGNLKFINLKGNPGSGGAAGEPGPVGPQGSEGTKGDIGEQGDKGDQGIQGIAGVQGIQGIDGPQGEAGLDGAIWGTTTELLSDIIGVANAITKSSVEPINNNYKVNDFILSSNPNNVKGIYGYISVIGTISYTVVSAGMLAGPQGQIGPRGDIGLKGDTGQRGDIGSQGIQGIKGDTGSKGDQGSQGPIGSQGSTGLQGIEGIQGIQGDSGISTINTPITVTFAAVSATTFKCSSSAFEPQKTYNINALLNGSDNIQVYLASSFVFGVSGVMLGTRISENAQRAIVLNMSYNIATKTITFTVADNDLVFTTATTYYAFTVNGIKGDQGFQGIQGRVGATGSQGGQGIQGVKGETGAKGDTGTQGAIGNTGAKGETGNTGTKGEKGETGGIGPQGLKGDQGVQGATGAKGDQGVKGATGAKGEQGIQGATGAKGERGIQGSTGAKGEQGVQGATGAKGDQGVQGPLGPSGIQPYNHSFVLTSTNIISVWCKVSFTMISGYTEAVPFNTMIYMLSARCSEDDYPCSGYVYMAGINAYCPVYSIKGNAATDVIIVNFLTPEGIGTGIGSQEYNVSNANLVDHFFQIGYDYP